MRPNDRYGRNDGYRQSIMTTEQLYEIFRNHPVITTDSRECPVGSMFFALKGDSFDGNRFASAALDKGCAYAIIDEAEYSNANDGRYILVEDALKAMQSLAHFHRMHFTGPVIEITGTNGKTTTKELVSAVLATKYAVLYTQGNFNNHIGVPKTLLGLQTFHQIAVIETGANHPGEIKTLADIVSPDCGLITNVGTAHIEGFGSFEGVVRTKAELYDNLRHNPKGFIFLNADNDILANKAAGLKAFTYGSPGRGYMVEGEVDACNPFLKLKWRRGDIAGERWHTVQTHLIGSYNLDNVLAAITVGLHYGVCPEDVDKALADYKPANSRSEMRKTARNTLVIDAYNANPSSMEAALENFALIVTPENVKKMLILGDMKELGAVSDTEHSKVVSTIQRLGFSDVWLVGDNFKRQNSPFPVFDNVDEVKAKLLESPLSDRLILIKGSNSTHLYQLPEFL